jgi:hypothetical protein
VVRDVGADGCGGRVKDGGGCGKVRCSPMQWHNVDDHQMSINASANSPPQGPSPPTLSPS